MGKFAGAILGAVEIGIGLTVPGMQWLTKVGISTLISAPARCELGARLKDWKP